jgi:hypothetical protein
MGSFAEQKYKTPTFLKGAIKIKAHHIPGIMNSRPPWHANTQMVRYLLH